MTPVWTGWGPGPGARLARWRRGIRKGSGQWVGGQTGTACGQPQAELAWTRSRDAGASQSMCSWLMLTLASRDPVGLEVPGTSPWGTGYFLKARASRPAPGPWKDDAARERWVKPCQISRANFKGAAGFGGSEGQECRQAGQAGGPGERAPSQESRFGLWL